MLGDWKGSLGILRGMYLEDDSQEMFRVIGLVVMCNSTRQINSSIKNNNQQTQKLGGNQRTKAIRADIVYRIGYQRAPNLLEEVT